MPYYVIKRDTPAPLENPMITNTEHLPCNGDLLSGADIAAEAFRARVGTAVTRRLAEVPAEWADRFTAEEWDLFTTWRFHTWHGEGWTPAPQHWLDRR